MQRRHGRREGETGFCPVYLPSKAGGHPAKNPNFPPPQTAWPAERRVTKYFRRAQVVKGTYLRTVKVHLLVHTGVFAINIQPFLIWHAVVGAAAAAAAAVPCVFFFFQFLEEASAEPRERREKNQL